MTFQITSASNLGADARAWGKRRLFTSRPRWGRLTWPTLAAAVMTIVILAAWFVGIRYNVTESMPRGFYRIVDETPAAGSVIVFCPPVDRRYEFMVAGSCSHGEAPYIKMVVGIAGDRVVVSKGWVTVNGTPLIDSASVLRPGLPHAFGEWTLKPGQVWTYGAGLPAQSFDSRYFGPVNQRSVQVVHQL